MYITLFYQVTSPKSQRYTLYRLDGNDPLRLIISLKVKLVIGPEKTAQYKPPNQKDAETVDNEI